MSIEGMGRKIPFCSTGFQPVPECAVQPTRHGFKTRATILAMQIRPVTAADLDALAEIDGTVESLDYLHLEQAGEGFSVSWKLDKRALRQKLIESNPLDDETQFALKQIAIGADEGLALMAEHEDLPVGLMVAQPRHETGTFEIVDLRIDYEHRRQGLATAMIYQTIPAARERELRA